MTMSFMRQLLWGVALLTGILAAHAGSADIGDDVNARIARAKSDQAAQASERARNKLDDDAPQGSGNSVTSFDKGCNIAIGTVIQDDKKIGTSARRETTVIVTGDIIQTGNKCR